MATETNRRVDVKALSGGIAKYDAYFVFRTGITVDRPPFGNKR
ncbi:MAG: hypothetical protein M5R36_21075 [Deltaproteobacteria bacterium]|nr:hypothetical protein [Deltaproteobacteria bacterium]